MPNWLVSVILQIVGFAFSWKLRIEFQKLVVAIDVLNQARRCRCLSVAKTRVNRMFLKVFDVFVSNFICFVFC